MTTSAPAGTTRRLIEFALGLRYEDLPAEVVAKAKGAILDTLGVTLVGSREPTTQMVALTCVGAGREGDATVLGATARTTPAAAALLNGYAAHTTDYDDSQHPCGTHMSAPVLAATLATAEIHHRTGKETLTGYLAGFELGCKLGRIGDFGRVLQRRGVHPTGFLGRFGAAAAAGRLMSLNAGQMNHTMGIAAGQAAGVIRSFGSMCKAFNAGNAAHDGVQAALLAGAGFTAPEDMFDGEPNVFTIGGGQADAEALSGELGRHYEITANTTKIYACTGWRNPVVEAMVMFANEHNLKAGDIAKVAVFVCSDVIFLPDYPEPTCGLEGKFSVAHAAAVGLVDRAGGVQQFSDVRVADLLLTALRRRIRLELDPKLGPFQTRVTVETNDGRTLSHFIADQKGNPRNPLNWDELVTKFSANAAVVLPAGRVDALVAMVNDIEAVGDIRELTRLCRPGM